MGSSTGERSEPKPNTPRGICSSSRTWSGSRTILGDAGLDDLRCIRYYRATVVEESELLAVGCHLRPLFGNAVGDDLASRLTFVGFEQCKKVLVLHHETSLLHLSCVTHHLLTVEIGDREALVLIRRQQPVSGVPTQFCDQLPR